jgi:hypothetical protein
MQRRFGAWADQIEIKISGGKKISFDQGWIYEKRGKNQV